MTYKVWTALALTATLTLAACDGNPFQNGGGGTSGNPPAGTSGTTGATAKSAIKRTEVKDTTTGNGYAEGFKYNKDDDTFDVDGLGFDGGNVYQRGSAVASLGPFKVYEGDNTFTDPATGTVINQFAHRAIYGVSSSGRTSFAVVRTGAYLPYGFGGFVYQRAGGVTLPSTGQAAYNGQYAALRDFEGSSGLEYATGDMTVAIDFNDFNDGAAVQGQVYNRAIFDANGNDITGDVISAMNTELTPTAPLTELPTLVFAVGPGVLNGGDKSAGEIAGNLNSNYVDANGVQNFETGKYYALITNGASVDAGELVGIVVVEAKDPRHDGVTVRETGGFILYR
ncbi:hypothetical protein [Cypionkella sp.]|uniref:hypothetical protein n=1 Tax=Cypionkella sp. TaxID=2811411 RepID=UPI00261AB7F0|nr:hypothetical protein [Cypionkella sp.]